MVIRLTTGPTPPLVRPVFQIGITKPDTRSVGQPEACGF
jgi:hypothetical protein